MITLKEVFIGVGGVALTLVGVGLYEHYKTPAAPTYAPGGTKGSLDYNLSSGSMAGVTLSLSGTNVATYSPPQMGGAVTSVSSDTPSVATVAMTSAQLATVTAVKAGTATITVNWTDASGSSQSSTTTITVTA